MKESFKIEFIKTKEGKFHRDYDIRIENHGVKNGDIVDNLAVAILNTAEKLGKEQFMCQFLLALAKHDNI